MITICSMQRDSSFIRYFIIRRASIGALLVKTARGHGDSRAVRVPPNPLASTPTKGTEMGFTYRRGAKIGSVALTAFSALALGALITAAPASAAPKATGAHRIA